MATFDHPSDLVHDIAYPAFQGLRVRTNSRAAVFPAQGKKKLPTPSNLQGIEDGCLFKDSLIASGETLQLRNLWAAIGSLAFQLLLVLTLFVTPLFHITTLPKRETVTLLYAPPPLTAASNVTTFRAPTSTSSYTSTKTS